MSSGFLESEKGFSLGCALMVVMIVYGACQLWAGYIGIEHSLGTGWAVAAVLVAFILRFTLPVTVGAFFGAMNVWGWNWALALLFAAPGIIFVALMIPGVLASVIKKR